MLMESRRETVQLLTNYEESYRSHDIVYVEIEKRDPVGASRALMEHFAIPLWNLAPRKRVSLWTRQRQLAPKPGTQKTRRT